MRSLKLQWNNLEVKPDSRNKDFSRWLAYNIHTKHRVFLKELRAHGELLRENNLLKKSRLKKTALQSDTSGQLGVTRRSRRGDRVSHWASETRTPPVAGPAMFGGTGRSPSTWWRAPPPGRTRPTSPPGSSPGRRRPGGTAERLGDADDRAPPLPAPSVRGSPPPARPPRQHSRRRSASPPPPAASACRRPAAPAAWTPRFRRGPSRARRRPIVREPPRPSPARLTDPTRRPAHPAPGPASRASSAPGIPACIGDHRPPADRRGGPPAARREWWRVLPPCPAAVAKAPCGRPIPPPRFRRALLVSIVDERICSHQAARWELWEL